MAILVNDIVIRRCNVCDITSDLIDFWKSKDSKSGRYYTHNICVVCRREYNYSVKYNKVSKEEFCKAAKKWNVDNRERYNKRRRKSPVRKFYES